MCDREDSAIGNRNLMGITAQIFDRIPKTIKSFLDIRTPVFCVKTVFPFFPIVRILKFLTGRRKRKLSFLVIDLQKGKIFSFELITQNLYRNEKRTFGFPDFPVSAQTAAGHDAMHMNMVIQFLVPCVEDLDDTGCCSEILPVSG